MPPRVGGRSLCALLGSNHALTALSDMSLVRRGHSDGRWQPLMNIRVLSGLPGCDRHSPVSAEAMGLLLRFPAWTVELARFGSASRIYRCGPHRHAHCSQPAGRTPHFAAMGDVERLTSKSTRHRAPQRAPCNRLDACAKKVFGVRSRCPWRCEGRGIRLRLAHRACAEDDGVARWRPIAHGPRHWRAIRLDDREGRYM